MAKRKTDSASPVDEIIESMPIPSEFSEQITAPVTPDVEPVPGENGSPAPSTEGTTAPPGVTVSTEPSDYVFNPEIHVPGVDGNGTKNKDGTYRRKPGRPRGSKSVATGYDPNIINAAKMEAAKTAAQVSVAATFILGTIILGQEGQPIVNKELGLNEPEEMTAAFTQFYYLSEKPVQIPPWMLIGLVTTGYVARRMAMEKPRARVVNVFNWIKAQAVAVIGWFK